MRTTEFKDTELGPIPKDWEVKRLGEVATRIGVGLATSVTQYYRNEGTVLFRNLNIKPGRLDDQDVLYLDDVFAKSQPGKLIHEGDVLSVHTGYVGISCVVPKKYEGSLSFTTLITTPNRDNLLSEYMVVYMNSDLGAGEVESLQSSGGRSNLNVAEFERLRIALPPLPEQRRIAAALGDVDKLIENLKKRVEKKKNLKRGAMQELLTGKRRLKGFTGAWVEKGFDEVFELRRNNTCARALMSEIKGAVHNLHYGDVLIKYGAVVDCEEAQIPFLTEAGGKVAPKDYLEDGDVVIADTAEDETAGKVVEVRGVGDRLVVSGLHTIFCRPRFPFAIGWLGYWMNSNSYHDQLIALMTGIKVLSLSRSSFKQTKIMYPPLPEQRAIAAVLSDMDAEIANLEHKLKKMTLLKQGMMQDLLTGKVRLA